jgi:hypothetical protein
LDTTLKFGGDQNTDLEQSTALIGVSYPVGDRTVLRAGGGWVHDGKLITPGEATFTFESGGLAFAGVDHRLDDGAGWTPSLDLSGTLGITWGKTVGAGEAAADYRATDLRLGLRTTWTIQRQFFPYAAVRVFGGPVTWDREAGSQSGSDVHHYQLAVGAALRLKPILLVAEFAGVGERGLSAGVGTAW